ncbi:urease accessory protein [Fibrobacter sp. UWH9]|uniref:urease accessory protein UreE n=1 Tax=unclassified Fibrobacter TaxID=2634177 RepID=UPI00091E1DD0|nr:MULTISPECIES: urease accessory protein UreE [unclassified Fibrobacter]SHH47690.1 urease accessory protein [Fibrobacter sp. UWH9]
MIADKILGNIHHGNEVPSKTVVDIPFEWFELDKHRIFKVADDGTELGIQIEESLSDGDVLAVSPDKIYAVKINKTKLVRIPVKTMEEMGRLGFELGNRHLSLQITEKDVTIPYDEPTFEYLVRLGFLPQIVEDVFSDYIVCKAHGASNGHSHSHDHDHEHHEHGHHHEHQH